MRFYFPPVDLDPEEVSQGELLLPDMAAYYSFDGAAGDNETDANGSAKGLTQIGSPPSVAGKIGTARSTKTATGQYFRAWPPHAFQFSGSFSITAWIYIVTKPSGTAKYHIVIDCGDADDGFDFMVAFNDAVAFIIRQQTGVAATIHANAGSGKWVFIAMIHDIDTKYLYGYSNNSGSLALDDSINYAITFNPDENAALYAGAAVGVPASEVYLDSIAAFNKALSLEEISWIYNEGNGRSYADYST